MNQNIQIKLVTIRCPAASIFWKGLCLLVFLILLLNNEEIMGKYRNTTLQNIAGTVIVVAIIVLSTAYALTTLFPEWLM